MDFGSNAKVQQQERNEKMKITVVMILSLIASFRFVQAIIKNDTVKTLVSAGEIIAIVKLGMWAM